MFMYGCDDKKRPRPTVRVFPKLLSWTQVRMGVCVPIDAVLVGPVLSAPFRLTNLFPCAMSFSPCMPCMLHHTMHGAPCSYQIMNAALQCLPWRRLAHTCMHGGGACHLPMDVARSPLRQLLRLLVPNEEVTGVDSACRGREGAGGE